ncbi:Uma2 family endonuclease [Thiocapsa sp.]|uniref:Uma2 family endonuclease n=1 Tax=Thiocapsa sp. TaxID=2024551 RepID=UPI002B88E63A|nr:Uma2 family endonuclease [Thiocapsa sp.]HSO81989.1 Uma2 family endonuclease [Thiocapsa sp.]
MSERVVHLFEVVEVDEEDPHAGGFAAGPLQLLSPSTAVHDQVRKRALYERHGVREYWLLHPTDRVLTIYRLGADGVYGKPDVQGLEGPTPVGVIDGLEIHWPAPETDPLMSTGN